MPEMSSKLGRRGQMGKTRIDSGSSEVQVKSDVNPGTPLAGWVQNSSSTISLPLNQVFLTSLDQAVRPSTMWSAHHLTESE